MVPSLPTPGDWSIHNVDAFEWLDSAPANSIQAVVTDPPYGVLEYTPEQLAKRRSGRGGVWRIPPDFDGATRQPLPRFTAFSESERLAIRAFFARLAQGLLHVAVPGAHVFIATNPVVSHLVYEPFVDAGFEKRGEIVRIVKTLRGGDRPKNAHTEFPGVSVMPRSKLGAVGTLPQAARGPRARQSPSMEDWRPTARLGGSAVS